MSKKIVYDYTRMNEAVTKINDIAGRYKTAGNAFTSGFISAIQDWEGESKDKMAKLINGDVNKLLSEDIPSYLNGLASLLNENINQMRNADSQIADSIPDQLG